MERRLAAILVADVVGYSRLIEIDEAGTLTALKAHRTEILQPLVAKHNGRVVKFMGDGVLVEFASAVSGVQCAVDLQAAMSLANRGVAESKQIVFRVGLNLGEVVVEREDIYGDGVNVAARLETLCEPGGVYLSDNVYRQIRGKTQLLFDDLGEQSLKNIAWPVRVYRVGSAGGGVSAKPQLKLPDKPSIALLPFQNMSGDPDQEYFADGIVEEMITALSRFQQLFVIARNSSFAYKGRNIDVKQVGRELGVRYVLEGSVRKAGSQVRITGQLIDTTTGAHLWADRFEGELQNIFALQDQVTASVIGAIGPKLEQAEIERSKHKPTESLDAYDHFLRGMAGIHKWSREGNDEALTHFYRAIELDPNYAVAHGMAARTYVQRNSGGWVYDRAHDSAEMERLADRAVELNRDDAVTLCTAGFGLLDVLGRLEDGDALIDRALSLNPNLAWAWLYSAWAKAALGESEVALERIARAQRLSPNDPQKFSMLAASAMAHLFAGHFANAYTAAQAAMRERPGFLLAICIAAVSAAHAGRIADAQLAITRILKIDPGIRISNIGQLTPIQRPQDAAIWLEGFRKAGLPE
jgi:TolB-like protein/class 3 adenylate cyclase